MKKYFLVALIFIHIAPPGLAQISQKSLKREDKSRLDYALYKSANKKTGEPKILVIALHWGWKQKVLPSNYSKNFLEFFVLPIFKSKHVIIIAPDCPNESWTTKKSIESVIELRNYYVNRYNISNQNIILTGFSLGGIGTWYLTLHHPELFPNAIPVAGYPDLKWINTNLIPNIYAINSFDDQVILFSRIDQVIDYLNTENSKIKFKIVYGVEHHNTNMFIKPTKEILKEFLAEE